MTVWNQAQFKQSTFRVRAYKPVGPVGPVLQDCAHVAGFTINGSEPVAYDRWTKDEKCYCGYTICSRKGPCAPTPARQSFTKPTAAADPARRGMAEVPAQYTYDDANRDAPGVYAAVCRAVPPNHFFREIPDMHAIRLIRDKLIASKGKSPSWNKGELELLLPKGHPVRAKFERETMAHCACGEPAMRGKPQCNTCASSFDYIAAARQQAAMDQMMQAQQNALNQAQGQAYARVYGPSAANSWMGRYR